MALLDTDRSLLIIRIVYDGPARVQRRLMPSHGPAPVGEAPAAMLIGS